MKISSLAPMLALMAAQGANAHTLFSELYVDGQSQGNGTCLRLPADPNTATDPIASLTSSDMACGVNGTTGVARVCSVGDSSTLTFEYREWPDDASKGSIDISHKGPCAVYLKKVTSAVSDEGTGDGWFKIWDEGYDESASKWCTEKLIDNDGHLTVRLPSGLQGGYYLVRPELLALHQADKTPSDPQFYVGCAQVFLNSTGTQLSKDTVSIPGYVDYGQPATAFNIWDEPMALPYPMPGPAVYSSASAYTSKSKTVQKQTEGLEPAKCVLTNANWAGIEVSKYSDEAGCWNASTVCWDQCTTCYDIAPPTGDAGCRIWEAKCQGIEDACGAGNFNGPPNYMKQLTPAVAKSILPAAVSAQTGDGSYLPTSGVSEEAAAAAAAASSSTKVEFSSTMASTAEASSYSTAKAYTSKSAKLTVSTDGSCGDGVTCQGSTFGSCCSSHSFCGSSSDYCGSGCQSGFGTCSASKRHAHGHGHLEAHKRNVHVGNDMRMMP